MRRVCDVQGEGLLQGNKSRDKLLAADGVQALPSALAHYAKPAAGA